ncbi:MAG TPA: CDP-glucose 4,6-dehydratase [Chitinophagaceae bacterium]|jgi:CDP-glucose 4,6-dehydratase|nr:CDP-glucose 4,6-dehydratase [Chitinophagaceae bacterium]
MFNNIYKGKKVIVTGNTGFKGSWLSLWLHSLGARVTGISKDIPSQPSLFEELGLAQKTDHHFENICNGPKMKEIFQQVQPDFVFHLAAQPIVSVSYEDPIETFQTNTIGTAHILEALRFVSNPCNAVIVTSDKCYDNVEWIWGYREQDALGGKDPYSASKGAAELVIKTYYHSYFKKPGSKVKLTIVRAGNVIGGGDWALNRIVPDCFRSWKEHQAVQIRNPNSTRPWQHVLEPLSGYLRAGQVLAEPGGVINGEPFNMGPAADQNHTVLELLQAVSKYWESGSLEKHFDIAENRDFHEAGLLKLNCDKALYYLQWKPALDFDTTARLTGEWYNHYYNHDKKDISRYTLDQIRAYAEAAGKKSIAWVL